MWNCLCCRLALLCSHSLTTQPQLEGINCTPALHLLVWVSPERNPAGALWNQSMICEDDGESHIRSMLLTQTRMLLLPQPAPASSPVSGTRLLAQINLAGTNTTVCRLDSRLMLLCMPILTSKLSFFHALDYGVFLLLLLVLFFSY